jgi:asparagine synthase (glutamine-hydrolysing)
MCGIYGNFSDSRVDSNSALAANEALHHRGPDSGGIAVFGGVRLPTKRPPDYAVWEDVRSDTAPAGILAHRRLSIIDLESGTQPMSTSDGRFWIVFNGEIYNHLELRKSLEALGKTFQSDHSDTEVLLASYAEWGLDCLQKLNGMFAFAILDVEKRSIFFARDRLGQKPIYYRKTRDQFEFASETKALSGEFKINIESLNFYLALGYLPGDRSIFSGVLKLPAAHYGMVDLAADTLTIHEYWTLPSLEEKPNNDPEALLVELESLLLDSVRLRMQSDVPIGVFLSGGLDSSLIVSAAASVSDKAVQTFTVSFPGEGEFDEVEHANRIASFYGTRHTVLEAPKSSLDELSPILEKMDEPLADSSLLPTYLVSRLAKEHVTVVLGGDGGDEVFGGCPEYLRLLRASSRGKFMPTGLWGLLSNFARTMPPGMKGRNFLWSNKEGPLNAKIWGTPYFDSLLRCRILNNSIDAENLEDPERWKSAALSKSSDPLDKLLRYDLSGYLSEDLMMKVDRASMMSGLEVRAPWLDYRIVEFAFRKLTSPLKISGNQTRWIQRRLGAKRLPSSFALQRDQGFAVPLDLWLRKVEPDRLLALLPKGELFRGIAESLIKWQNRGCSNASRIFGLMMLTPALRAAEGLNNDAKGAP